jgi:hypothetical protein
MKYRSVGSERYWYQAKSKTYVDIIPKPSIMDFSPNLKHVFKNEHILRLQLLDEYASMLPEKEKEVGDRTLGAKQENTPSALKSLMELAAGCGDKNQTITLDDQKPYHKDNESNSGSGKSGRPPFLTNDGTRSGKLEPSLMGRYLSLDAFFHNGMIQEIKHETTELDNLNFQMFLFFHCFERVQFGYPGKTLKRSSGFTVKEVETIAYCLLRGGNIQMLYRVFPYLDGEQLAKFVEKFQEGLFFGSIKYGDLMSEYFDKVLSKTHTILFKPVELKDKADNDDDGAAAVAEVEKFKADELLKKKSANV